MELVCYLYFHKSCAFLSFPISARFKKWDLGTNLPLCFLTLFVKRSFNHILRWACTRTCVLISILNMLLPYPFGITKVKILLEMERESRQ